MEYTFAAQRQLSFIISVGGRNRLVSFGNRNQAGVAIFMTSDEKVANVIRRHPLSRRRVIQETTVKSAQPAVDTTEVVKKPAAAATGTAAGTTAGTAATPAPTPVSTNADPKERVFDNYTVARETICKELNIKKAEVRNPTALANVAKEHGIIIKYKEL